MKRTGRGRSAAILAVFLGAASFDGSWQGAARLDWLLFPLASLAVGLLLRKAAGRGGKRVCDCFLQSVQQEAGGLSSEGV